MDLSSMMPLRVVRLHLRRGVRRTSYSPKTVHERVSFGRAESREVFRDFRPTVKSSDLGGCMTRNSQSLWLGLGLVGLGALVGLIGGFELRAQAPAQPPATAPADTAALRAAYDRWRTEFKTWNRWGADDNKGASNLITPQKVMSALKLAKSGTVVSLGANVPQREAADVPATGVFRRTSNNISDTGTSDTYAVSYHGQSVTHMDSWCHFLENGQMYNGIRGEGKITQEA